VVEDGPGADRTGGATVDGDMCATHGPAQAAEFSALHNPEVLDVLQSEPCDPLLLRARTAGRSACPSTAGG
jgi:hypothetical protein